MKYKKDYDKILNKKKGKIMEVRVRFAPSPTGQVHIGNIRTAIFNWLFARHEKGKFLIRVEDTDLERSTQDAKDKLFECMDWLGLDYDEDVMYQSQNSGKHIDITKEMIDKNQAYYLPVAEGEKAPLAFRIPISDDISSIRTVGNAEFAVHQDEPVKIDFTGISFAQISKKRKAIPVSACLAGFKNLKIYDAENNEIFDLDSNINDIISGKSEFMFANAAKFQFTRKEVFFNDMIKGELSKPLDSMKDLIIVRGNGSPVFHIANVCDDIEQKVTHIVRGDDHVENTYRHLLLFDAIGGIAPIYAHMPMIVNQQGKPYSKRDGDAFVGDFKAKGFLPNALFNYLSLLGWSPGDDREKMTIEELVEAFQLEKVQSSPAQLDMKKLENMNGQYLMDMDSAEFAKKAYELSKDCEYLKDVEFEYFAKVALLMQPRTKLITQLDSWKYFFTTDFEYNEKALKKQFKKDEIKEGIAKLAEIFANLADFNAENIIGEIHKLEEELGLGQYKLMQPLRLAISGVTGGADLDATIIVLGKDIVCKRITDLLGKLG